MKNFKKSQHQNQAGFVAIFSVIFFALLAMVITVGFMRITVSEQRQALNNDLTARALAAAEAGTEDAKRAIERYNELPEGATKKGFSDAFEDNSCDSIYKSGSVIQQDLSLDTEGQVDPDQNLFYTCLDVNLNTADFVDDVAAGDSIVVPLRTTDNKKFNNVNLQWHQVSDVAGTQGDGKINKLFPIKRLPNYDQFGNNLTPAYMRVQMIAVPKTDITRKDLHERTHTVFLTPAADGQEKININIADKRGPSPAKSFNKTKTSPENAECDRDADNGVFACEIGLVLPTVDYPSKDNKYYLRIKPIYRGTTLRVQMFQGNNEREFKAVQPLIDSTGKVEDTFRRTLVRVSMPGDGYDLLDYGVQTAGDICKQFQVATKPDHYSSECDSEPGE